MSLTESRKKQFKPRQLTNYEKRSIEAISKQPPMSPEQFREQTERLRESLKDSLVTDGTFTKISQAYKALFQPCEIKFEDAMVLLWEFRRFRPSELKLLHEMIFDRREEILDVSCESLSHSSLETVSRRIDQANTAMDASDPEDKDFWQLFLDRVREVVPEMLAKG